MKINKSVSKTAVSLLCLSGMLALASSAQASIVYNDTLSFISGTGNSAGGWTTSTDNGLALSLRSQYNNSGLVSPLPANLTPNDGAGTFTFGTGSSSQAQWDAWFNVNPGSTTGNTYVLTINNSLGGSFGPFNVASIADNAHNPSNVNEFQNAEDIGFSFIGFDPSIAAQYTFNLTAYDANKREVNSVNMTVNNGFTPVPEPTTVIAGALLLLPLGVSALRIARKHRTA